MDLRIYGLAAVIAVFHDTLITIGLFSIFHEEISMTANRRPADPSGLLDERHHRDLRPHPRNTVEVVEHLDRTHGSILCLTFLFSESRVIAVMLVYYKRSGVMASS